jgi:fucose permease
MNSTATALPVSGAPPPLALTIASWIARLAAAAILLQTLYFKFTAHPDSVAIFIAVGMEPWGRYASGVTELVAGVLMLVPRVSALGGLIALGVIGGAIVSHLTVLGIVVNDDGGSLFALAVVVFLCSAFVAWVHRRTLPVVGSRLG